MIKTANKLGVGETYFNIIKAINGKTAASTMLNKVKSFSSKIKNGIGLLTLNNLIPLSTKNCDSTKTC